MKVAVGFGVVAPWYRGCWARRPYVITDGYLTPMPSERTDVYPLLEEDAIRREGKGRSGLVEALLQLDTADEAAVIRFASEWGLLGLFSHQIIEQSYLFTEEGWLAPRHRVIPDAAVYVSESYASHERWPLARAFGGTADERCKVSCVETEWFLNPFASPTVHPLNDYYRRYFPRPAPRRVRQSDLRYPSLHSRHLWDHLCEPLTEFRQAVSEFQAAGRLIGTSSVERWDAERQYTLTVIEGPLHKVEQRFVYDPAAPAGEQPWRFAWVWPSLYAVAYLLLARQAAGNLPPRFCGNEGCTKQFVPRRPDHDFCSISCQTAQRQRRHRRSKKSGALTMEEGHETL